jgi:molybdopterin molybdotransferase
MVQLSADCFAHGGALMRADAALVELRRRLVPVVETETAGLTDATGRVLAADLAAARDVPPHANAAVDGYAFRHADLPVDGEPELAVAGRAAAGHPVRGPLPRGSALRIFTGAPLPDGPDAPDVIAMQEDCELRPSPDGDRVALPRGLAPGSNIRARGEDVRSGSVILTAGTRLRPQDIGLAASVGITRLDVFRQLRVALFSTGDEVHEPGTVLPEGGIYDANRYCLRALLDGLGFAVTDLGILPDDAATIREALADAAAQHDAIVTSAGMSVGEEDHMAAAIGGLGRLHFWKLAIKPGRPVALGQIGSVPFIGLPGNPAAMMVTFLRIARPALLRLSGATALDPHVYRVRAGFDHRKKAERREFVRVRLSRHEDGTLCASKFPREGAGILSSLVEADGLVELAEETTTLTAGSMVDFVPFSEVIG